VNEKGPNGSIGIVAQMDELFAIDGRAREQGLTHHDRQVLRLQKARPLLKQIKTAIEAARIDALPKSPLAKACNYTLTLWSRLTRFLDYPVLELSNNLAEKPVGGSKSLSASIWAQPSPGLADFPISRIAELTPAAWATRN
jgi:Transposase IS66 family